MRASKQSKNKKKPSRYQQINKKRYKNKSRFGWGRNDDISGLYLENLNEVLRENKFRRGEGKGNWKIMPRDSCEIYKARQRRMESSRRRYYYNNDSNETDSISDDDYDDDRKGNKKQRKKKSSKKREPPNNFRPKGPKGKNKKRRPRSRTISKTSETNSSVTHTTSYTTVSDMEY
ncbi:hypothetical protein HF086_013741 [Spodoptera exigua]|uniref:Uncharacterized protein n=1 Tax=Spodoptera exigua TaxID=7107 RepID=A0A922MBG5_SPOEX|nr:hypothetical protein HF086_013741 [Spodoptera exigua]